MSLKVCLIKPPILHKSASFALLPTAPLGLAYIAGALNQEGHQLQVIDASAEGFNDVAPFIGDLYIYGLGIDEVVL